ncbi:MAG: beta-propeller domain-containing protein [Gemmobacter sp.]|nr:beta-propeller domain-containing protein [Gemmobacter sp.]
MQVLGVDEADIVKNDAKYLYVVTGNKIVIVDAYPAASMEILSEIKFDSGYVQEIYINDDKLVVFGTGLVEQSNT